MAILVLRHQVANYDAWRKVYDSVGEMQTAGGVTDKAVFRAADDPNTVLVYHRFATMAEAQAFPGRADLGAAMAGAGVDLASIRAEFYEET